MLIEFRFDDNIRRTSMWRMEKITEQDLPLVRELDLITWDGGRESDDVIVKYGTWTISADRTAVFNSAGGGSFEIPEMYDLYFAGHRIRLECGGAGERSQWFEDLDSSTRKVTFLVTDLHVPPALAERRDALLAMIAEAFAVRYAPAPGTTLLVQFRTYGAAKCLFQGSPLIAADEDSSIAP